jgi:hypothetical protein
MLATDGVSSEKTVTTTLYDSTARLGLLRNPQLEYQRYRGRMMLNCYPLCSFAHSGGAQ